MGQVAADGLGQALGDELLSDELADEESGGTGTNPVFMRLAEFCEADYLCL